MKILKLIITGAIAGTALFLMPFLILKIAIFFVIGSLFFKLFIGRRFGPRGMVGGQRFAFADKVRNMTPEEYISFKANNNKGCGNREKNTNKTI